MEDSKHPYVLAEFYFSSNNLESRSRGGCWIIVARKGWLDGTEIFEKLFRYIRDLAEAKCTQGEASKVLGLEDTAAAAGINDMKLPAPVKANHGWMRRLRAFSFTTISLIGSIQTKETWKS